MRRYTCRLCIRRAMLIVGEVEEYTGAGVEGVGTCCVCGGAYPVTKLSWLTEKSEDLVRAAIKTLGPPTTIALSFDQIVDAIAEYTERHGLASAVHFTDIKVNGPNDMHAVLTVTRNASGE